MLRTHYSRFALALSFLTLVRLPTPSNFSIQPRDLAASFAFFPLIGLLLGIVAWLIALLARIHLPAYFLAVWIVAVHTLLTRGLHLDGLADCVDGLGGSYEPARRLAIMKDSRVGAFGVQALVIALLLKTVAVYLLISQSASAYLVLVPILSRCAMVLAAWKIPYARKQGLGKSFLEETRLHDVLTAGVVSVALAFILSAWLCPIFFILLFLTVYCIRRGAVRTLGGVTGDVLGACNEITELVLYSLAVILST